MPGPGHPGHFPKPPGWTDRPARAGRPSTGGPPRSSDDRGRSGAADPPRPGSSANAPGGPPGSGPGGPRRHDQAASATASQPGGGGPTPPGGGAGQDRGASRAQDAASRVAELLGRQEAEDGEAVDQAAEAVEHDIDALAKAEAQRDEYLDSLRRLQADFENYKKRIQRQHADLQERAAEKLVESLLPVLDNFDLALAHASDDAGLEPVYRSLLGALASAGLDRMDPGGQPFDPNEHDAVLHEPGDAAEPEVIEVLRAGYRWKGRVLRPAMVKVKG